MPLDSDTHVEHFFRHEYGKLVAVLSSRIGVQYIEDVEDAVQSALMTALETWPTHVVPDNPSAWLYRVAHNNVMGALRKRTGHRRLLEEYVILDLDSQENTQNVFLPDEVRDDMLRMLFLCCDESVPRESQLALALKILCGFDVREIALSLFTTEANVYKRLSRARKKLREQSFQREELTGDQYSARLSGVHQILYLLFTEGYLSSHTETSIRRELCNEAIRLASILANHPIGRTPETYALLALFYLHVARLTSRQDASGGLLLLEEQNREDWDHEEIQKGLEWLGRSAQGAAFSRYHAEAGIAAEHCLSSSFQETRWDKIAENYELLEQIAPSILHTLNRVVAVAEWKGAEEGLAILKDLDPPIWLGNSYMWSAVFADLHRRCGNDEQAQRYFDAAISTASTLAVRNLLQKRFKAKEDNA